MEVSGERSTTGRPPREATWRPDEVDNIMKEQITVYKKMLPSK